MNTLTLKIPDTLQAALERASARRHISKSAMVREALEKLLADELKQGTPAAQWLGQWRGVCAAKEGGAVGEKTGEPSGDPHSATDDARVAHILRKHLR